MGIRLPLQTVIRAVANDTGTASVAGGVPFTFTLPQDTDNVVMKVTASLVGASASATFQTSDDGGTTWYDVVRTPNVTVANNTVAVWATVPTISNGYKVIPGSIVGGAVGSAAASVLAANSYSGLPILSPTNRIFVTYTGNITTNDGVVVEVKANNQDQGS